MPYFVFFFLSAQSTAACPSGSSLSRALVTRSVWMSSGTFTSYETSASDEARISYLQRYRRRTCSIWGRNSSVWSPTLIVRRNSLPVLGSNDSITHRSEEHTSELQSQSNLVCRLLLEKKK